MSGTEGLDGGVVGNGLAVDAEVFEADFAVAARA